MSCNDIELDKVAHLSGDCPPEVAQKVERHRLACAECDLDLRNLKHLWECMGEVPDVAVPDPVKLSLQRRLRELEPGLHGWERSLGLLDAVIGFLLLLLLGLFCPIPGVCHFFEKLLSQLQGTMWGWVPHLFAGAAMGLPPLLLLRMGHGVLRIPGSLRRDRIAFGSYFLLASVGVPLIGILPPMPPVFAGWTLGLFLGTGALYLVPGVPFRQQQLPG